MKRELKTMWWEEAEGQAHTALVELVDSIRSKDPNRAHRCRVHQDVYEGRYLFADENGYAVQYIADGGIDRSQLNFTRSAVDFVHMKVTAQRPSVKCASRGADWSQAIRARRLTRFLEAQSDALELDEKAPLALSMALRTGTGAIKASAVDGKVHLDVVPIEELCVDPGEGRYGKPPHLYQVRAVPRDELLAQFSEDGDIVLAIQQAGRPKDGYDRMVPDDADMVDVYEGWQLPDADGEGGRHVACVEGATLTDEEWKHDRFPIAFVHDAPPAPGRGFWGQSLVERLLPVQWEIDGLVGQINTALRIGARLKVFVDRGSKVNLDHLAEPDIGAVIEYDGRPPTFAVPEPVPRELLEHLKYMVEQLFSQAGMSQDAAASMKPAGLSSGVALVHFHDFQTQRHVDLAKRYSRFVLDVAELVIDRAKDLSEQDEDWTAKFSKGSVARQIAWSEVDMERDQFVLELETVSAVPESYAGRLQMIERMAQGGQMPESLVAALIEDPDTVRMNRMLTADAGYIEMVIEMLIDPEESMPPVRDEQNIDMSIDLVRAAMLDAITEGAPPEVVERFETYLQELADRKPLPPAAPPTPMAPPGGAPPGLPPMM